MKEEVPILKSLRTDFELSQKIIIATAILFNFLRIEYCEDDSDDEEGQDDQDSDDSNMEDGEDYSVID